MKKDSTKAIRNQLSQTVYREHSAPVFLTSSFVYDSAEQAEKMFAGEINGDIYSRFTNPNTSEFINKMSALEGAKSGVATASGMAAIFASLAAHLKSGDHVMASTSLFGNSLYIIKNILSNWGIDYSLVNIHDTEGWKNGFQDNTRMLLVESPSNPGLDMIDLKWLSEICRQNHVILCVDNCFATPILQKPLSLGAHLSLHSGTKYIDGQGRVLGGVVLGDEEYITPIFDFLRRTGACLSPFNAWILSKSLETLDVRMDRHCSNALALATFLESHDRVERVRYPFLPSYNQFELAQKQMTKGGGIVCCNLLGGKKDCFSFINHLQMISITANLGDTRTIVTHPATTTHSKLSNEEKKKVGITDSTIRISVGLEGIEDIVNDIAQALSLLH